MHAICPRAPSISAVSPTWRLRCRLLPCCAAIPQSRPSGRARPQHCRSWRSRGGHSTAAGERHRAHCGCTTLQSDPLQGCIEGATSRAGSGHGMSPSDAHSTSEGVPRNPACQAQLAGGRPTHLHEVEQLGPGVPGDGTVVALGQELAPVGHQRPTRGRHQQLPHRQRHVLLHALLALLPAPASMRRAGSGSPRREPRTCRTPPSLNAQFTRGHVSYSLHADSVRTC